MQSDPAHGREDELVEKMARKIMLAIQLHDFGHRNEKGEFICSPSQIDLLTKCCAEAARAALAVARPAIRDECAMVALVFPAATHDALPKSILESLRKQAD